MRVAPTIQWTPSAAESAPDLGNPQLAAELAGDFRRQGEELLSGAGGAPPLHAGELRYLLEEHVADEPTRARILAAAGAA